MERSTRFDLASLTKVLATTLLCMLRWQQSRLDLDSELGAFLPSYYPPELAGLTPRLLLTHTAGLPPFVRLCETFEPDPADGEAARRRALEQILSTPLVRQPATESQYSDLGLIILGDLLEQLEGQTLDRLCERDLYAPLGLAQTWFVHLDSPLPNVSRDPAEFASTEDCPWRGRVVRGQVHDENAYILRGVAGHAGLFSTVDDLTVLAAELARPGQLLEPRTVRAFTARQEVVSGSDRALGWGTASPGASCGSRMSARAFGHTGFTGTSLWIDGDTGLWVVLLSNRVHPSRENTAFLTLRPVLHDLIVEHLGSSPG
jgi:CubicO group peptidase (beta-lactamase class C family)